MNNGSFKHFHRHMAMDQDDVDLLIVMGSSLKVGPVNDIPDAIDESVPRILSMFLTLLHY